MKKLNRLEAALLCAELACLAYPAAAAANNQIYNTNIETTDAVTVEIDATASGAIFAESTSGRYAGIGAYITDDWTDDNTLPSYTITANGITITGATSEAYRLYGLAAYYASLNVDSSVAITLSLTGDSAGQLRAIRNNYYGTITLGGDVTAKLTNASTSSSSATYGFDNWGYATTVNGDVDMELSSDYTPIFGIYSQGNDDYAPATVFNKDLTLTITAGENNASEVDGVYGYISTTEFNGDTTITVEDKYSGDVTSYVNSVFLNCDNNAYATTISFNGETTSLTSTTVAKDNYGVSASGPTGSISFTGKTVTVSSSSASGLAFGLDAQYGATISVGENTALTVTASSTSGDAMAVIADCYSNGNGSIAIAGAASLTASSDSGSAFGVYNYGVYSEEEGYTGSGSVTLTGDTEITASSGSGYAFGVYTYGDAETALSGETITITATADDGVSYGVYAGGGADVTVGAPESSVAVSADCAIYADAATVTLTASEMALEGDVYAGAGGEITLAAATAELDGSLYAYGGTITVDVGDLTFADDACIEVASVTDEESSQSYDGAVSVTTDSAVANVTITGNVVATASGFTVTSADAAITEGTAITFAGSVSVTGAIAGDAVTIAQEDNSATSVTFNSITFDLTEMEAGAVMLTVGSAVDLDGLSVGVENADASELTPGDALTLMYDEQGISNLDSATVDADGTIGYTLSGLGDAYLEGTFGYSIYLDDAATSLIFSAGTDISVTDLVLASSSDASEGSAAAAALSLDWGSGALLTLEEGLTYDFSNASLEAADSVTVSGVEGTLLASGDSYQLIDGTEATVSGLASLVSDDSEAGSLSAAYSYEPASGVTVTGTALYVGTDTDESTAGSLALSVSSIDEISFGTITYSDSALITLDTDKTYDLAATSVDVSDLTVVDSEGSPVSVTYDDAEITDSGTVYMTLIDASEDTGLSVEDGATSQSFGYTLTSGENSLTGTMAGVVTVKDYDLMLAAASAVTVSELTLDTSSIEWGADALLTLNSSLSYDFSDSSLDVSDSVAITGVSSTLLAASDAMTLLEVGSASVSGLASLISDASATYSYEPASGVTVAGSATYSASDEAGISLSVSSIDAITFSEITYSDEALITLDTDKSYDLSGTSIDVSDLTVVDSEGSPVSVTYDDSEITDGGAVYMTLIDASEATGLSVEDASTSQSFGYTLTSGDNALSGTMDGIVTVKDYDLVLAAESSVAVSTVSLDTSSLEWGSDALLTLNDSLAYDFTSASVSGLDETSITTGSFLDVDASTTLVDTASAEVSGLSALEGLGGTYSYSLLDGVVTVTGSGSLSVSSGNVDYTIASIDTMDFYITSDTASGSTILTVATADLSGTAISAYAEGGSYLTAGYEVTLLTAEDGLTTDASTTYTATITEGVSVEYDVDVYQDGDSIVAVVAGDTEADGEDTDADTDTDTGSDEDDGEDAGSDTDTDTGSGEDSGAASGSSSGSSLRSETKSLVETRLAQLAMLEQGADLLTNAASDRTTLAESREGWAPFAAVSRASYKYATGSYVDIDGFNATVGVMKTDATPYGSLTYGAAFQYGSGEYDSHAEGVKARGDTEYKGGSLFIRSAWNSGAYLELSLSRGTTEGDYKSSEILGGVSCSYKDDAPYWGASFGAGRELDLGGARALDVYARYFYSHINDSSVRLSTGETYDFDSTDSSRLRLGARYTRDLNRNSRYYAGLAYEYQFDGAARASYNGMSTLSPSLEGSSGMLEAGVLFAPEGSNLTVDLGVTGWAGTRKGVEGRLMFNISF